jgi:hypothetical protein
MQLILKQYWILSFFEKKLKRRKIFPKTWVRYVDDVFGIVHKDKIDNFLALLNCQHESIKFTHEIEVNETLPFLISGGETIDQQQIEL